MKLELPTGESHEIERKRGSEDFKFELAFKKPDEDDTVFTSSVYLSSLVDQRIGQRSDITESVVREAVDTWFEEVGDEYDIESIRSIEIVSTQPLRKTPYSER